MRLINYLNESDEITDDIIGKLKKDCSPIISLYKKTKLPIYRGLKNDIDFFVEKKVRKNRKPRVIGKTLHKLLDELYLKHWGFKARSQGLFCGAYNAAANWGEGSPYIIFPVGKFKYVYTILDETDFWSNVLTHYEDYQNNSDFEDYEIEDISERIKDDYFNKGIEPIIKSKTRYEVIINCNKYYAIKENIKRDRLNEILYKV